MNIHIPNGEKIVTSREICGDKPPILDFKRVNGYLQDIKKVFDETKIPFCLFFGTLLGAVRENDFIYYDSDVDVAILLEDAKKVDDIIIEFQKLGYNVSFGPRVNNILMNMYISKIGLSGKVDIYTLVPWGDYRVWARPWVRPKQATRWTLVPFPKKHFENFDTITFLGKEYKIPSDIGEFLEYQWGKWWIAGIGWQFGVMKSTSASLEDFQKVIK